MSTSPKRLLYKLVALFTVIRGYNVGMLVLAMYITAYFIFSKALPLLDFLDNPELHLIILASAFTISGGYIINNFYDLDKDTVSRPLTTYISRFISQNLKLTVYLTFCLISLILAFVASWRIGIFFVVYNFLVWLYCHKISRITLAHNLFYVILSLLPFIALLLFYNNYSLVIFLHGIYLGLLILCMDIIKDLTTHKADLIFDYNTIPVTYGINNTKLIVSIILSISFGWTWLMTSFDEVGQMKLYFIGSSFVILVIGILLWVFKDKWQFNLLYLLLKLMLGVGVLSIAWIKINPLALQKFFPVI